MSRLIEVASAKQVLDWNLTGDAAEKACELIDQVPTVEPKKCKNCEYLQSEIDATNLTGELATVYAKYQALLQDIHDYQGSICGYCKNLVREKGVIPKCKCFESFPLHEGVPLQCGKFMWRGEEDA